MPQPITLDHLKSKKKPVRRSVRIATDEDVAEAHRDAKRRYEFAKGHAERHPTDPDAQDKAAEIKAELVQAEKEMAKHSIKFVFEAIGYKEYDDLQAKHIPTPERRAELLKRLPEGGAASEALTWDPDTYPLDLIVTSMIEPDGNREDMMEWLRSDAWNMAEINALFAAAVDCNTTHGVVQLGNV